MAVEKFKTNENSNIKHVIGIVSGKGGVGKSFVTSLIASELRRQGKTVGILDADITGPSIPKSFGITDPAFSDGKHILPSVSKTGVEIMSVNLILQSPTQPVLWRGPIIGNALSQFFSEVNWGDLDYLLVDMPPGTGDVALTVFQSMPVDGAVIVTSPQDLVSMIVEKAVNMTKAMNVKVLGLVENMSYFKCPCCGEVSRIYGESSLDREALKYNIENKAALPMQSNFAKLVDEGNVEDIEIDEIKDFVKNLMR